MIIQTGKYSSTNSSVSCRIEVSYISNLRPRIYRNYVWRNSNKPTASDGQACVGPVRVVQQGGGEGGPGGGDQQEAVAGDHQGVAASQLHHIGSLHTEDPVHQIFGKTGLDRTVVKMCFVSSIRMSARLRISANPQISPSLWRVRGERGGEATTLRAPPHSSSPPPPSPSPCPACHCCPLLPATWDQRCETPTPWTPWPPPRAPQGCCPPASARWTWRGWPWWRWWAGATACPSSPRPSPPRTPPAVRRQQRVRPGRGRKSRTGTAGRTRQRPAGRRRRRINSWSASK